MWQLISLLIPLAAADDALRLDRIQVSADLRQSATDSVPASISVLDREAIEESAVQHLQDLLERVPNLNWQAGSSRPRYFQIRGIGEDSQYQGAPNPSVGFLIDDVDFSALGMPALVFDLEQVEVLRGPQPTRYGGGALGGLIYLRSRAPASMPEALVELRAGNDGTRGLGLMLSQPLNTDSGVRLAVQGQQQDGFRDNLFLGRDDTNGRDERLARLRMDHRSEQLSADLSLFHADLRNGYDAFAIDNSLQTQSDRPGRDSQRSNAGSLRFGYHGAASGELQSITALGRSDAEASFDGDWGNDPFWAPFDPYDFFSATLRERRTASQELRWISAPGAGLASGRIDWVVGLYAQNLDEKNQIREDFNGELFNALDTDFSAQTRAAFVQFDWQLGARDTLVLGLRRERQQFDYRDSNAEAYTPSESLWGGRLAWQRRLDERQSAYLQLTRGYKAGGFNIGPAVPAERRLFGAESLLNLEAGWRVAWPEQGLSTTLAVFHMRRRDQQVASSVQFDPTDPLTFVFLTDNAGRGRNSGLESEWLWRFAEAWSADASLGLLRTRIEDCRCGGLAVEGRAQANAPQYLAQIGLSWQPPQGWFARLEVAARDEFYFADSHDQRSQAYELINARLGYRRGPWSVEFWGRNLGNTNYATRGFSFGNEPPDFPDRLYIQRGDPRWFGLSLRWTLGDA